MDRRRFIRDVLLWSAGLTLSIPRLTVPELRAAPAQPLVAVAEGMDPEAMVRAVLSSLGGMKRFVRPGERVVVKPNIGWDRTPEQAANTHPLVVRALVEEVLAAGAARVQVFDRTCNEKRRCYKNSGIEDALGSLGSRKVRVEHVDDRKFVPVEVKRGKSLTRISIYRDALEADRYINVPIAKHHGLSRLTLGLKNSMGVLGGRRGTMHFNLGQKLADLATVIQPTLTLVDATRMLMDNGPQGGSLEDVKAGNTVLASTDPVAADAWATTLFDLAPDAIESTVAAYRMGLGEMRLERMRIVSTKVG
ncbi:MAG: DUF362 domain-containing protein [Desulfobulbaceae bacterium]